jgi:hypothetical protein
MGRNPDWRTGKKFASRFQATGDDPKEREKKNYEHGKQREPFEYLEHETPRHD